MIVVSSLIGLTYSNFIMLDNTDVLQGCLNIIPLCSVDVSLFFRIGLLQHMFPTRLHKAYSEVHCQHRHRVRISVLCLPEGQSYSWSGCSGNTPAPIMTLEPSSRANVHIPHPQWLLFQTVRSMPLATSIL